MAATQSDSMKVRQTFLSAFYWVQVAAVPQRRVDFGPLVPGTEIREVGLNLSRGVCQF